MTTLLDAPLRVATGGRSGGGPARRAVTRWAWRMFRREWRRQALVLVLLMVAVAATVFGLGVVTNASVLHSDPTFGNANTIITIAGSDPELAADIAAIQQHFGTVDAIDHESLPIPGSVSTVDLRAQNPRGAYGGVTLRVDSGRFPTAAGEVAVTRDVANTFGLHTGSAWNSGGQSLLVVGIVENPLNLLDQFALVPPGQIGSPSQVSILVDASRAQLQSLRVPSGAGVDIGSRGTQGAAAADALVLVLGTLGLAFVGLMGVAGFAVTAQRRLRALGLLGSLGARSRHIRLVMLANGAAVGVTAAVLGAGAGVLAWFAFSPTLQSVTEHHINRFSLPWWAIAAAMVLTLVTAVAAAWWPARAAARMSVVAALSGRPPRPQPSRRFAATGGLLLAVGIVLLAFADQQRAPFIIAGTVTIVVGVLLLSPLAIRALAAAGNRSAIAVRLALRDLVRYQARSGAALGAITLAVGIAATIAISASASETPTGPGNLPNNQLMLYLTPGGGMSQIPPLTSEQQQMLGVDVSHLATSIGASAIPLEQAYEPQGGIAPEQPGGPGGGGQPAGYPTATLVKVIPQPHGVEFTGPVALYVETPAVLSFYGLAPGDVATGTDVVSSQGNVSDLQIFIPVNSPVPGAGKDVRTPTLQPRFQTTKQLPAFSSAPDILITGHAMQALGLQPIPAGWLLQTAHALTPAQIATARKAAVTAGLYVETRKPEQSGAALRNWSTAAGILLALGVLAMTVGLIRSETSNDLRTLTASGATSGTRRLLTGVTSGALAFLGALVGTAGAYAALLAWHRSDLTPLGQVPTANLIVILIGLPAIAACGGWLLAGRTPEGLARRPAD